MKSLKILSLEDIIFNRNYEDTLASIPRLKVVYLNKVSANPKSVKSLVNKIPWAAVYYEGVLQFSEE